MISDTITISEIYGPVIQGEGPLIGRPTVFVRIGGCDDRCSWCDSLHAVLPQHAPSWRKVSPHGVLSEIYELAPSPILVTLSGGNPALQDNLAHVIHHGGAKGYRFAMETQGTVCPPWLGHLDDLVISPKPPSSGNETSIGGAFKLANAVENKPTRVSMKVVVATPEDLVYASAVRSMVHQWAGRPIGFYVQPCNPLGAQNDADTGPLLDAYRDLSERVLHLGWHDCTVLPQLHTLVYGAERRR